jgi:hypothetical protein
MSVNIPIGFALLQVKTEQFAVIEGNYKESEKVELNTSLEFKVSHDTKAIGVFIKFIFEQAKCPFLIVEVSCHFNILDSSWEGFGVGEDGAVIIPKNLLQHLGMITVGTARGVLHAKTEGTTLNKFFIPTVNVVEMVTDDGAFLKK